LDEMVDATLHEVLAIYPQESLSLLRLAD